MEQLRYNFSSSKATFSYLLRGADLQEKKNLLGMRVRKLPVALRDPLFPYPLDNC